MQVATHFSTRKSTALLTTGYAIFISSIYIPGLRHTISFLIVYYRSLPFLQTDMSDLRQYTTAVTSLIASTLTYPMSLTSNVMAVSGSRLAAGCPPNMACYAGWWQCLKDLRARVSALRGNRVVLFDSYLIIVIRVCRVAERAYFSGLWFWDTPRQRPVLRQCRLLQSPSDLVYFVFVSYTKSPKKSCIINSVSDPTYVIAKRCGVRYVCDISGSSYYVW